MELHGHFDGQVIVLDEPAPADLRPNAPVLITLVRNAEEEPKPGLCDAFLEIAARARGRDLGLPPDFSEQHDHYIHGTPKR